MMVEKLVILLEATRTSPPSSFDLRDVIYRAEWKARGVYVVWNLSVECYDKYRTGYLFRCNNYLFFL